MTAEETKSLLNNFENLEDKRIGCVLRVYFLKDEDLTLTFDHVSKVADFGSLKPFKTAVQRHVAEFKRKREKIKQDPQPMFDFLNSAFNKRKLLT